MSQAFKRKKGILLESGTNEVEFLRVEVASSYFGINVAKVRKAIVFEERDLSLIPGSQTGLLGNYLYRGECLPIIDTKTFLGIKSENKNHSSLIIICEFNKFSVGFLVDRIRDIMRCSWECFAPADTTLAHADYDSESTELITGNVIYLDQITPILDVEAILAQIIPQSGISRDLDHMPASLDPSNSSKHILYCEDSPTVRRVLLKYLKNMGFVHIISFATGKEALDYLEENPKSIDLIISDIEMPRMDGLSFCKAVRGLSEFKKLPFVFFSSTVTSQMREKCINVGGTASFSKPEISELAEFIQGYFTQAS